jgi:hypothetical protein
MAKNALEAALPSLISKLKELQSGLNADERQVFAEIIESAANHTVFVQADDEGRHDKKLFAKPKSAHSTVAMKKQYLRLPEIFGIKRDK